MSKRNHRQSIEVLESRRLLAAGAVLAPNGTLTVTGTNGDDVIVLERQSLVVTINGAKFDFEASRDKVRQTVVQALGGNDEVTAVEGFGYDTPITLNGGAGDDLLWLFDKAGHVVGGAGDDTIRLYGDSKLLSCDAGTGTDTLDLWSQFPTVDMRLYPGLENCNAGQSHVIGNNLDNVIRLGDRDNTYTIKGGGGNDTVIADGGPVYFDGEAGNDTLVNLTNSSTYFWPDTFIGGAGNDTIDYSSRTAPLYVDLKSNPGTGGEAGENDSLIGVENALGTAIYTPDGTFTVTGTSAADEISVWYRDVVTVNNTTFELGTPNVQKVVINALGGDDQVWVNNTDGVLVDLGAGNDTVALYDGIASVIGGAGNDEVQTWFSGDYRSFDGGSGIDTINLLNSFQYESHNVYLPSFPTVENVLGSTADVTGNALNNYITLRTAESNNALVDQAVWGGGGNDTVVGSDSPLYFDGGSGDDVASRFDTFVGGTGSDTVDLSAATVPVLIDLAQGIVRFDGNATGLQIVGVENAIGGSANDTLVGDGNRNVLNGGAGNDTITGGGGKDVLIGGEGNDLFLARDGKRDVTIGGDGIDSASLDKKDWRTQVELLLA